MEYSAKINTQNYHLMFAKHVFSVNKKTILSGKSF
jgi:hypothetical protein